MAKKSIKDTAAAGTSVFDQIASGNVQNAPNVTDVQNVQNVKDAKPAKDAEKADKVQLERLNLKIPADIKEYLTVAAAKASIAQRRNISLTEYLCELVRADMEKHKND